MTLTRGPLEEGVVRLGANAPPETIGDYRVVDKLGSGSAGVVYRAVHSVIGREVAIKILHLHRCHDAESIARFVAEARAANQIHHPGIIDIEGFGVLPDGRHYCVMELVNGRSLAALLEERGRLPFDEARPLLRLIAEAVDAAHRAGIAHRDLKPENVMVQENGAIKVIDFGLARLSGESGITQTGAVLGTPRYMAPEQCRGQRVDEQADLYAFGALAYHLLTGSPPFVGDPLALALHHINDTAPPASARVPELGPAVDDVLTRLLAKSPGRRPRPLVAAVDDMTRAVPRTRRWRLPSAGAALVIAAAGTIVALRTKSPRASNDYAVTASALAMGQTRVLAPWISADGREITFSNEAGLWSHNNGVTTLLDAHASYQSRLADGRRIVTRESADGPGVWLDELDGTRHLISAGAFGEASPRGTKVAIARDHHVVIFELDGQRVIELPASLLRAGIGRWSPDATRGIATDRHETFVAESDGAVWPLSLDVAVGVPGFASTTFFGSSDNVLYCARGKAGLELRLRQIAKNADHVLWPIPGDATSCELASNGRDVIVVADHEERELALLGNDLVKVQASDSRLPIELSSPSCPGEIARVRWRGEPRHVARDKGRLRFLDAKCVEVATWSLPDTEWSAPSCAEKRCVLALGLPDRVELHAFEDTGDVLVGSASWQGPNASFDPPLVAISPDANHVAVAVPGTLELFVFSLPTAEPRRIPIEPSHRASWMPESAIQTLAWGGDADGFVVGGVGIDALRFAIFRIAIDGTRRTLWSSDTVMANVVGRATSGEVGVIFTDVTSRPFRVELRPK